MTFAKINENTFTLNNILFPKSDLTLLLECCGYDISPYLSGPDFLERAEYTLSTLIGDPVFERVFDDFKDFGEPEKALWRQFVMDRKVPSSN